jgi:ribose transport system permease protein
VAERTYEDRRGAVRRKLRLDLQSHLIYVGFLVLLIFFMVTLSDRGFATPQNFINVIRQSAVIAILAIGMTFVLTAGEIDLSIGSVLALAGVTTASLVDARGIPIAVAGGLAVGLAVGLFNGVLVAWLRIPSFLVTLGTMGIVLGIARQTTGLMTIAVASPTYNAVFGGADVGGVPTLFLWAAGLLVVGHVVYRMTPFGRQVIATGANLVAARWSGVNTARIKTSVLVISSLLASVAGMLDTGRLHGVSYNTGSTDLMTVIAATVIGGTSLFGGRGSIVGAAVGAIMMSMVDNGLILMGLSVDLQMIVRGFIIIAAVVLSLRGQQPHG